MSEIFSEIFGGTGSGGSGSPLLFWDPLATQGEFGYQNIEAGVKKAGTYNIINNPTQATIDGVPQNTSIGTTIAFIDNGFGWSIVSQTTQQAKYTSPSSVADETVLNATFPIPEDYEGQYCYVQSTNTYWTVKLEGLNWIWYDTGEVSVETYSKTEQDALFQANSTTDRNRANHIGTQLASTISDFDAEVENNTEVFANTTARHSHTNKAILDGTQESFTTALKTNYDTSYTHSQTSGNPHNTSHTQLSDIGTNTHVQIDTHIASTTNPHSVTKAQVGLGNVDNTSDVDKPISTAQQNALDTKVDKVVGKQLSTEDYTTVEKNKLAGIQEGAEVNIQADWEQADNLQDSFIQNKPTLGTVASKDVGTAIGNIQENGAILGSNEIVETDANGKLITSLKSTAYNKNFGTANGEVAQGDASYLKADTYSKLETNILLGNKEDTANKGVANGYVPLNASGLIDNQYLDPSAKIIQVSVANETERFALTIETVQYLDQVKQTDIDAVFQVIDVNNLNNEAGYQRIEGSIDWSDLQNIPNDIFYKNTDTLDNINEGTTNKHFTIAAQAKLSGVEDFATADQTPSEIKASYESNADTNAFTDAEKLNLSNQSGVNTGDETISSIQSKRPLKTIEGYSLEGTGNIDLTKADVGLNNVDNTSDLDKPPSTATQNALDTKLTNGNNLNDVNSQQVSLNNITAVSVAENEYVLTKDTATGNAIFKALPTGSVPDATETLAGKVELASQTEAEAGTDDTNKAMNPLKTKQAFDVFITSHETQKIFARRNDHVVESYGSNLAPIEIPNSLVDLGTGLSYLNGVFTVTKNCRLLINLCLSFRNNSDAISDDTAVMEIQKSTNNGLTYLIEERVTINPSELVNAGNEMVQAITANVSFNANDKFQFAITDVSDTQLIVDKIVNIMEQ